MSIKLVRHLGDPNKAETLWGTTVERRPRLYVPEMKAFINCTPYDNHFIYAVDKSKRGFPGYMCTCGAAAVIATPNDIEKRMFVCLVHAQFGRHTMSS